MADADSRSGVTHATLELLSYLNRIHASDEGARKRAFEASLTHGLPAIQVGPSEGKALFLFLRMIGARRVVEVGTLAGYSAIHLASALPADGHLWTLEADPKHAAVARENLDAAGFTDRVTIVMGKALETLPSLVGEGPFDAVFVDADKGSYDHYGRWAAANLRRGGLLLGDNAYYFGRLLEESDEARAMRRFHEEASQSFDAVCLPTPDGLFLGIKK
jgi:caffeoyl-CoA O-methyltransferase